MSTLQVGAAFLSVSMLGLMGYLLHIFSTQAGENDKMTVKDLGRLILIFIVTAVMMISMVVAFPIDSSTDTGEQNHSYPIWGGW